MKPSYLFLTLLALLTACASTPPSGPFPLPPQKPPTVPSNPPTGGVPTGGEDTQKPTLTLSASPLLNNLYALKPDVTFTVQGSDNVGVTRLELYQLGKSAILAQSNGPTLSFKRTFDSLENGKVSFYAKAFDAAGNSNTQTLPFVVELHNYPTVLRKVNLTMLSPSSCQAAYPGDITDSMMCAGSAGLDSCQGDSGGPLVASSGGRPLLVGTVSWGNGCAVAGNPGVYARLSRLMSWLRTTTGLTGSSAETPTLSAQVVGGQPAPSDEAPWMAGLVSTGDDPTNVFCGATLIAKHWVLTAAHCVFEKGKVVGANTLEVILGTQDLTKPSTRAALQSVRVFPDYQKTNPFDGDMALLELKKDAIFSPLELGPFEDSALVSTGKTVTVYGWGDTLAQPTN